MSTALHQPTCPLCDCAITYVQSKTPDKTWTLPDGKEAHVRCIARWEVIALLDAVRALNDEGPEMPLAPRGH